MQRIWEPREQAFSFLLPQGWTLEGGVFNVNPLQMNGPGNTTTPKCDLTVKADARGTVMLRWVPSWNYADLSLAPTGWGTFRPGMHYQGMPVRPIVGARQFLTELIKSMRPQAADIKIVAEDPLPEVAAAYARRAELINQNLQKMGLAPTRFEALALVVEYREAGEHFREVLSTTIADARGGAFMWSNDDTIAFRAPVSRFEEWKPASTPSAPRANRTPSGWRPSRKPPANAPRPLSKPSVTSPTSPTRSSRTAGAPMPRYATNSGCSSPDRRSTPTPSTARPSATPPITSTAG